MFAEHYRFHLIKDLCWATESQKVTVVWLVGVKWLFLLDYYPFGCLLGSDLISTSCVCCPVKWLECSFIFKIWKESYLQLFQKGQNRSNKFIHCTTDEIWFIGTLTYKYPNNQHIWISDFARYILSYTFKLTYFINWNDLITSWSG